MSDIEAELQKATKINPRKKEGRQSYLKRLIGAVEELKDDAWEELSQAAQEWANEGVSVMKKDGDDAEIEDFPDIATAEDAEEEAGDSEDSDKEEKVPADEEDDEDEEPKDKKKAKAKGKDKAPAAKKEKAEKPEKRSGPKPTGIKVQIKKMVLKKPSISVDEIMERLSKDGTVKPSKLTISAIRSEFRHSLFVLRDQNALSADIKLD